MSQKSVPQQCQKLQSLFTMWAIYSPILITHSILFMAGLDGGSHLGVGDLRRTPRQPESRGQKRFLLQVSTLLPSWLSPSPETSVLVHIFIMKFFSSSSSLLYSIFHQGARWWEPLSRGGPGKCVDITVAIFWTNKDTKCPLYFYLACVFSRRSQKVHVYDCVPSLSKQKCKMICSKTPYFCFWPLLYYFA